MSGVTVASPRPGCRPATPDIRRRLSMTASQIRAVTAAAEAEGVVVLAVYGRTGRVDEMAIWQAGENVGSVFRSADGGLATWISTDRQRHAASAADAVRKVLDGYGAKPPGRRTESCGFQRSDIALGGVSERPGRVVATRPKKPPAGLPIGISSAGALHCSHNDGG